MNLRSLRCKRLTKAKKILRTTRSQQQGINSKDRDNCEDEDQFKSHGRCVSKEARWNTALHHTLLKLFFTMHVNITDFKKCKYEQMNAPLDIAIFACGNLLN